MLIILSFSILLNEYFIKTIINKYTTIIDIIIAKSGKLNGKLLSSTIK